MEKEDFAKFVLTDDKLKNLMQEEDFQKYKTLKQNMKSLDFELAGKIACAMKTWAISLGATLYSHWFFPLTSNSAGKLVSFFDIDKNGEIIQKFDGNCLIKGETDASSFPSGNERMTFEARGYTIWDYSSPAFIKSDAAGNKVLYIPTAFCSYNGVALDEKTPLLRASESLSRELTKFLHFMGLSDVCSVNSNLGIEQEYFLIPKEHFKRREDLVFTGRTLLSSPALKSQESYHHYFGNINSRVSRFMHDLDKTLCKLGIIAKIQHSEVAPSQFEIVSRFGAANISTDQNMLLMEVLDSVAERHNLKVLLHEKPFSSVNGSGKHNNWSFSTDTGLNLLDKNQVSPEIFMATFSCILSAINKHYDLFRLSTATPSNDQRLGGNEAPPATISVYVGSDMAQEMQEYIAHTTKKSPKKSLDIKTFSALKLTKDDCDRNRTSPIAYTGGKFEFRMVGSAQNTAFCNTVFCMTVADEFRQINEVLSASKNIKSDLNKIIEKNIKTSQRIIYNGNCYDSSWISESAKRGLKTFENPILCFDRLKAKQNIALFCGCKVMSEAELQVRFDTCLKTYYESVITEANTLSHMIFSKVEPAITKLAMRLLNLAELQNNAKINAENSVFQAKKFSFAAQQLDKFIFELKQKVKSSENLEITRKKAMFACNEIVPLINQIRMVFDEIEPYFPADLKPFPDYNDLLFW